MKFVDISTALYNLFHHEQPPAPQPQPQTIYIFQHVCITHGEPLQEVAPGTWQCPKQHTSPVPVIEQPHGRYFLAERSRYTGIAREPTHELKRVKLEPLPGPYEPPEKHTGPISHSEDTSDPDDTEEYKALSQLLREGRGKAS